jgi:FAD/FMN-containing dehydrogenase
VASRERFSFRTTAPRKSERKISNAMIDKHPAAIVRRAATSDVVRGMNFARGNGLWLAVRGGGHNIAGNAMCDDGIVVDLSRMKAASVDPNIRWVTIEGGATLADLDATQAHGLATPVGINPTIHSCLRAGGRRATAT